MIPIPNDTDEDISKFATALAQKLDVRMREIASLADWLKSDLGRKAQETVRVAAINRMQKLAE